MAGVGNAGGWLWGAGRNGFCCGVDWPGGRGNSFESRTYGLVR